MAENVKVSTDIDIIYRETVRPYRADRGGRIISSEQSQKDALSLAKAIFDHEVKNACKGDYISGRDDEIEVYDWKMSVQEAEGGDWNRLRHKFTQMANRQLEHGLRVDDMEDVMNASGILGMIQYLPSGLYDDPNRPIAA